MTGSISVHAVHVLKQHSDQGEPFSLDPSSTAPHRPLHAKPEDIQNYCTFSLQRPLRLT